VTATAATTEMYLQLNFVSFWGFWGRWWRLTHEHNGTEGGFSGGGVPTTFPAKTWLNVD